MATDIMENHLGGVRYFGRMTASVSHELKNVLAIINENNGLLEDYCLMAERGLPLTPDKLSPICSKIASQVRRGDQVIKQMNQFAHSADKDETEVDLSETVQLAAALSARYAAVKEASVELEVEDWFTIQGSAFAAIHLATLCLEAMINASGRSDRITVRTIRGQRGRVEFIPSQGGGKLEFPIPEALDLAGGLGAEIEISQDGRAAALDFKE